MKPLTIHYEKYGIDKKSMRNLIRLWCSVGMLRDTLSKQNKYYSLTFDWAYTMDNTDNNRQEDLMTIAELDHSKAACRIINKVFKKYHVMKLRTFIKKIKRVWDEANKHNDGATMAAMSDLARRSHNRMMIAVFAKSPNSDYIPTVSIEDSIPASIAVNMVKDFDEQLCKVLPGKLYSILENRREACNRLELQRYNQYKSKSVSK